MIKTFSPKASGVTRDWHVLDASGQTLGRLADVDEFGRIVVKTEPKAVVRLKDVAQVELAAQDYTSNSYLDRDPAVGLAVFQRPGSNALATAKSIQATMQKLAERLQ